MYSDPRTSMNGPKSHQKLSATLLFQVHRGAKNDAIKSFQWKIIERKCLSIMLLCCSQTTLHYFALSMVFISEQRKVVILRMNKTEKTQS